MKFWTMPFVTRPATAGSGLTKLTLMSLEPRTSCTERPAMTRPIACASRCSSGR